MKDLSVWLVVIGMPLFPMRYVYQIWKGQITPTLSTWVIFLLGTSLSLTTYAIVEKHDFRSGILNTMDVVSVVIVLLAIVVLGEHKMRFKPFEKWYLGGIGLVTGYGLLTGDAWGSNIFAQVLIGVGYFPTIQNLLTEKRNTESFTAWGLGLAAGIVALYPAMTSDGNSLAVLYATRTIVCVLVMLTIMIYYEFRSRRVTS